MAGVSTNGLCMWLKSSEKDTQCKDGEPLYEWLDESGNNLHVRQTEANNQPCYTWNAIEGHPGVKFGPASLFHLDNSFPIVGDRTFIFMQRCNAPGLILSIDGAPALSYSAGMGGTCLRLHGEAEAVSAPLTSPAGVIAIVSRKVDQSLQVFYNGAPLGLAVGESASSDLNFSEKLSCPAFHHDLSSATVTFGGFSGFLGEVLVYSRVLPDRERAAVEQHLGKKFRVPISGGSGGSMMGRSKKGLPPVRTPLSQTLHVSRSAPRLTPMSAYPWNPVSFNSRTNGTHDVNKTIPFDRSKRFTSDDLTARTPGPQNYTLPANHRKMQQSFNRTARFERPSSMETPGCNFYVKSFDRISGRKQSNHGASFGKKGRWDMNGVPTPSPQAYYPNRDTYLPRSARAAIGRSKRMPPSTAITPAPNYNPDSFDMQGDGRLTSNHAVPWGRSSKSPSSESTDIVGPNYNPKDDKIRGGAMGRASRFNNPQSVM